ncbi:MAG: hypothetical protein WCA79_05400 [Anaerolineales bacterium]
MKSTKIKVLVIVLLVSVLAAACGPENTFNQQVAVAVVVGLTETAVALQQPSPSPTPALQLTSPEATIAAVGTVVSFSGYQPLSADECKNLNVALAQSVGSPGSIQDPAPFADYINQKNGIGCLMSFSLTSTTGANGMDSAVTSVLQSQGWAENTSYRAASPTRVLEGYQNADALCLLDFSSAPADAKLCLKYGNYDQCMGNLQPSQIVRIVTINCAKPVP